MTEVKYRFSGKVNEWWAFKAYNAARVADQVHFDLLATEDITLTGKHIPGGELTLSAGEYNIEWVVMNDRGAAMVYTIDTFNDAAAMMMMLVPHSMKYGD